MPVSQAIFSNTEPESGEIRVLVQTINNVDFIKAVTVSNQDLDGNNMRISLSEAQSIRAALTGSVTTNVDNKNTLTVASISEKPNYFFLDTEDQAVQTVSGSLSSIVGISPFLSQPFFYNNYNAILSNASEPRKSVDKFDVDRVGGFVHPSNYTAVAGIGEIDFTDLKFNDNGNSRALKVTVQSSYGTGNNLISGSTTTGQSFSGDKNVTVRVDKSTIEEAIGFIQRPILEVDPKFFNVTSFAYSNYSLVATSSLNIEIDSSPNFNSSDLISHSLADQSYVNGDIITGTHPFIYTVTSGSLGDNVHVRLSQVNRVINSQNNSGVPITIKSYLYSGPGLAELLPVRLYYDEQQPYAPLAEVQDSNYTTTGHTNARYNGSKTTEEDYSGIEPFLAATPVEGALYRFDEDDNFICSQSINDRVLEDFLFLGSGDLPTATSLNIGSITNETAATSEHPAPTTANVIAGQYDQTFYIKINTLDTQGRIIKTRPGSVLLLTSGSNTEVVQLLNTLPVTLSTGGFSLTTREFQVSRRYDGSGTTHSFGNSTIVSSFTDTRIFKLEGNRLVAVNEHKVWVKDNRTIIKTSNSGYVTSLSTTCTI